jgi:hypothetical protein
MSQEELQKLRQEWQEALDVAQDKWELYIEAQLTSQADEAYQIYREAELVADKLGKQYKELSDRFDPELS